MPLTHCPPYIEVHDDSGATLEPKIRPRTSSIATIIINGDLATSYRIALGIALRRLEASRLMTTEISEETLRTAA